MLPEKDIWFDIHSLRRHYPDQVYEGMLSAAENGTPMVNW